MLTKSERYFWDADAVREPSTGNTHSRGTGNGGPKALERGSYDGWVDGTRAVLGSRNMRNIWSFPVQPYKGAHFATFPEELPRRAILAASSARGACACCGAPWRRVVKVSGGTIGNGWHDHSMDIERGMQQADGAEIRVGYGTYRRETVGWTPGCDCRGQHGRVKPCLVLDPFGGSGTTASVAVELNRSAVSLDLAYHDHVERRTRNVQRTLAAP
jgi:DNA methylase